MNRLAFRIVFVAIIWPSLYLFAYADTSGLTSFWEKYDYSLNDSGRIAYCKSYSNNINPSDIKMLVRDVEKTDRYNAEFHCMMYSIMVVYLYKKDEKKAMTALNKIMAEGSQEDRVIVHDFVADINAYRSSPDVRALYK